MSQAYRAAAIQMSSGPDKSANLATATRLVHEAAAAGAELIALPEMFACLGPWEAMVREAEPIPGPSSRLLSDLAARLRITLVAGSFCEQGAPSGKAYNTSLVFGPNGKLLARYRKIHLFDIDLPGRVMLQESRWLAPGNEVVVTPTAHGRLGQAICYDLRFGELFARLSAARSDVICLPSAFTAVTGRDHWEVLVRARAIENQAYVIAPNQVGRHTEQFVTYGHSLIVDPWGTTLASAAEEVGFITADIDLARLAEIRARLPALEHRRALAD
jgi:predicted amidohydrolase